MMLTFTLAFLFAVITLYPAGMLVFRSLGFNWQWACVCAPATSLCLYSVIGELYRITGVPATPFSVIGMPLVAISIICFTTNRLNQTFISLPQIPTKRILLYAGIGLLSGLFVFVRQLPSLDAVFQNEDIVKHALQIQAFIDAREFTSLHSNVYLSETDVTINPYPSTGNFYPSAWHIICTLVAQASNCGVPIAMNVTNLAFSSLVYPLSTLALMSTLFNDEEVLNIGALACISLTAFPWAFLVFGPLFPNLSGMSCVPIVSALFIGLASEIRVSKKHFVLFFALLSTFIGMVFAHPNAAFSLVVMLIPYCIGRVYLWFTSNYTKLGKRNGLIAAILTTIICFAFWFYLYSHPSFQNVVNYNWRSYTSGWQGLINILSLSFTAGFRNHTFVAQPLVAIALVTGARRLLHNHEQRWLIVSYIFSCIICIVSMSSEGNLKHFLAGFWYTDPFRLAATAAVIAVPIVSLGLKDFANALMLLAVKLEKHLLSVTYRVARHKLFNYFVIVFLIYIPTFTLPGIATIDTAFTNVRLDVKNYYSLEYPYSPEERAFVEQVKEVIPEDALVINEPLDGSILAYGFDDLRTYYRSRWGYGSDIETQESLLIREHLCDIANNPEVAEAVDSIGAEYVLLLDTEGTTSTWLGHFWHPERFYGITMINDYTPGFELVLSDGRCRLYRIAA